MGRIGVRAFADAGCRNKLMAVGVVELTQCTHSLGVSLMYPSRLEKPLRCLTLLCQARGRRASIHSSLDY